MAAVCRRLILYSAPAHFQSLLTPRFGQFFRPIYTAEGIYPQSDADQISLLSSHLSSGQVSETITKLIQWRYNKVAISDAVYRHVIFSPAPIDHSTLEALVSFINRPDDETILLSQFIRCSNFPTEALSSASDWSSLLLCKVIEIASERRNASAMNILQRTLLCRADSEALQRAAPHVIYGRLSTNTHSQIQSLLDHLRVFEVPLDASSFDGTFDIDSEGSSLSEIYEVFEECVRCSLRPDAQIFTDLLYTITRSKAHQTTIRSITRRLLKQARHCLSEIDINLILNACARSAMPAEGLRQLCNSCSRFQSRHAVSLIRACANIHNRTTALFHLRAIESAMMHYKVEFTIKDYRSLLHVYANFGRDRLETAVALSNLLPDLNSKDLTARLRLCHDDIEQALMLLPRGNHLGEHRPNTDHFRFALLTMAKTRSYHLATRLLDLFNDMRKKSLFTLSPDEATLSNIYNLVLRSADNEDFEYFLQRLLYEDKIVPNSVTLIALYEYCAGKDVNHWHRTHHLIQELKSRVRVDGAVCSFAVRLLLPLGLLHEAVELVGQSERHRPGRNRVHPATYRVLLKALVDAKESVCAQKVIEMQKSDGLKLRRSHLQLVQSLN